MVGSKLADRQVVDAQKLSISNTRRMEFTAEAEIDRRVDQLTEDELDDMSDAVTPYRGRVTRSLLGRARLVVTVQADDLTQATAVAGAVLRSSAPGRELVSLAIHRSRDFVLVSGLPPTEGWASVSEVAAGTSVSRQAVLQQIASGSLAATKVGSTWIVARAPRRPSAEWRNDDEPVDGARMVAPSRTP